MAIVQIADEWSKHLHDEDQETFYAAFRPRVDEALATLAHGYPAYPDQTVPPLAILAPRRTNEDGDELGCLEFVMTDPKSG